MPPPSILSQYLRGQKTHFLRDYGDGWTIVIGNEAGDLDSVASSIGYAWYRSHVDSRNIGGKAVALMPMPRSDFCLRAENVYALAIAGVHEPFDELLCPEDIPPDHRCTDYALVDHNNIHDSSPNTRVVAVVDHHEDEGKYYDTASPRVIEPAGSCASLVTRLFMSGPVHISIPPDLAGLLLSAIAIDTQGLRKGGKALDVDRAAAAWLHGYVDPTKQASLSGETQTPSETDPAMSRGIVDHDWLRSLADTLRSKKIAVSHLSTRDLLRRDYKQYALELSPSLKQESGGVIQVGLATVPLPLSAFFKSGSAAVINATISWMEERGLTILGILTTYRSKKDKGRREQLWIVKQSKDAPQQQQILGHALFDGLDAEASLELKPRRFSRYGFGKKGDTTGNKEHGDDDTSSDDGSDTDKQSASAVNDSPFGNAFIARVYKQKNTHATRKQVAPLLKRILGG
ncbi:DHH phosphoesterase [Pisolithus croceorrhizus]|nr:DHH phosphoesterase [Pisolithus croceorrhizus]KAI6165255.1 DHH phosphoesterase [Pisolithus thermaeus]